MKYRSEKMYSASDSGSAAAAGKRRFRRFVNIAAACLCAGMFVSCGSRNEDTVSVPSSATSSEAAASVTEVSSEMTTTSAAATTSATTTSAETTALTTTTAAETLAETTAPDTESSGVDDDYDDEFDEEKDDVGKETYYVNPGYYNYVIRLYDDPSEDSSFTLVPYGTKAEILKKSDDDQWVYIRADDKSGWCWHYDVELEIYMQKYDKIDEIPKPKHYIYNENPDDSDKYVYIESLNFRAAPSYSADVQVVLDFSDTVRLFGYNDPDEDWYFAEAFHNGKTYIGWVDSAKSKDPRHIYSYDEMQRKCEETGKKFDRERNICGGKPVLYLYPEKQTDINVKVRPAGRFWTTYPKYGADGWNVTAYPDGSIVNKADGHTYDYLFWDTVEDNSPYDMKRGFCVKGCDTEAFLREKLAEIGLNEREMNEFIVYWLPLMEHNKYNVISFQNEVYSEGNRLNIAPAPDSLLRVFMTYRAVDRKTDIQPQTFEHFERRGFTAVEWGGTDLDRHGFVS